MNPTPSKGSAGAVVDTAAAASEGKLDEVSIDALRASMPAYVLGALSAEERIAYERVLRRPEHATVMRAEFDACQLTVNALAASQPVTPPEGLYERIVARIGTQEPHAPATHAPDKDAPVIDRRYGGDRRNEQRAKAGDASVGSTGAAVLEERRRIGRRADDPQPVIQENAAPEEAPANPTPAANDDVVEVEAEDAAQAEPYVAPQDASHGTTQKADDVAVVGISEPALSAPVNRFTPTGRSSRVFTQSAVPAVEVRSNALLVAGWWIAAVLFLALCGAGYYVAQLTRERDAIDSRNKETRALLSRSDARLAERERLMATLLGGRASVMLVNLRSKEPESPEAQLFWNIREAKAVLNVFGLAQLPSDRLYQLWMIRDGVNTRLVEVAPNDAGAVLVPRIDMPSSPAGVTQVFITSEARGENPEKPSAPHIISGTIPIQWP